MLRFIKSMCMKILVTGSSGHLGEALVRTLGDADHEVIGLDVKPSPFTTVVGTITDRECVKSCMAGVDKGYHASTLHKPHIATHSLQEFVETNIQGTLTLLEEAANSRVSSFVFTSGLGDRRCQTDSEEHIWRYQNGRRRHLSPFSSESWP